jgi:YtoQ family protein
MNTITAYLAGEIHSDWRERLVVMCADRELPIDFVGPQFVHDRSDSVGEDILGPRPDERYRDLEGGRANSLRTRVWIQRADVVVAFFGEKYRQWNTAADAGAALALGTPLLLVRPMELRHALKELDAGASFTVENLDQAVEALAYIFE